MAAVTATLTADVAQYIAQLNRAAAATTSFATKATAAGKRAADSTKSFADRSLTSVQKHKDSINTLSNGLGLFGAAAAAGVAVAVGALANFDQAMSNVAATGQDAKKNLESLRKAAIEAGASTQFSATEAAEGIENLAKAGVSAKDTLGGGLKGALDLAAAGQIGVADAAETAATAMTQFNLTGKDVPHIADLLAAGAGKAQGEVSDMAQALKQSGLVASQFGLSIEDTTGSLAAFASAGLIGSDAGTAFKTMLLSLANPSKKASDTMKQLGINAYDAQGNFVGVTNLAGQLQSKLGGLTEAQRNAALATIFGTDAIRAANVLYTQGASGIQQWINNVNDTGYAAEVAATKMDNLKGDLEQLKGAAETALIGLGEGANGPLRDLVKSATDAVNAFNNLSSGTKSSILAVIASLAGVSLATAALGKLVVAAAETRAALVALGLSGTTAAAGLRSIIATAGPAAAALAAVAVAGEAFDKFDSAAKGADQLAASLKSIAAGSTDLSGLYSQGNWADSLRGSLTSTADQAKDFTGALIAVNNAANPQGFKGWLVSVEKLKESITPGTQGLEKMQQQVSAVDQALAQMASGGQIDQAAAAFSEIAKQAQAQGFSMSQLLALFPQYKAALGSVGGASSSAAAGTAAAGSAVDALGQDAQTAEQSLSDLVNSLFAVGNAALATSNAQVGFRQAIDAASKSAEKNGRTLNTAKKAGQENRTALNNLAAAGIQYVESLVKQGKSSETVVNATKSARAQFVKAAQDMGKSSKKANELADSYGLIPNDVKTKVSAPGAKGAKADADKVKGAVKNIPTSHATKITADASVVLSAVERARGALNSLDGKVAHTYIVTSSTGKGKVRVKDPGGYTGGLFDGQRFVRRSEGGPVWGAGTATSDSIPALLSNGEFVIRASAVRAVGSDLLHAINAQGFAAGGHVGYATGGSVDAAAIMRLIAQLVTPLSAVQSADAALRKARASVAKEQRDVDHAHGKSRAKQVEELRAAQEKLRDSTTALRDAQNTAADAARSMSDQFSNAFRSASTDAHDWIESMQTGAKDISGFTGQIAKLRKMGLSETLIQQLIGQGTAAGSESAASILAGGKGFINQLNKANNSLQKAADALGYLGSTKPQRKADGGPISGPGTGTSDSVLVAASNGEYIVNAAASAVHRGLLDQINYGRSVVSHNYARPGHYRYGGPVSGGLSSADLRTALAGMRISGQMHVTQDRAWMEGVVLDVVDRESSAAVTRY